MKQLSKMLILLTFYVSLTISTQAQENTIPLGTAGWKLWLDKSAAWKTDKLYLPPVDINELPVNAPTGGWNVLSAVDALDVKVPGTVEEYCWDRLSGDKKGLGTGGNYEGVSWWIKSFEAPPLAAGKRVKLFFTGGIRQRAEIYVNEKLTGYELVHQTPFEVDITAAVNGGETNRLAVRITDANGNFSWPDYSGTLWGEYYFPLSHGFGGILGEVELKITHQLHVSDVFVKNKPTLKDIEAEIEIINEGKEVIPSTVSVEIIESWKNNAPVSKPKVIYKASLGAINVQPAKTQTISVSASVPAANLWEIKNANLYDFVVTLKDSKGKVQEKYTQRFGFRFLSVEGYGSDARFYFNGKRIFLLSAISWGFWPANGIYPTPGLARKHIESAQTIGQNMLHFHRCQGNSILLDLADEMGILYYEEPGGYSSHRTKTSNPAVARAKDFELAKQLNSRRFLRLVKHHRNHPSLVMYNMVNEPGWDPDEQAATDMAKAQELDPTRFISYGSGFMNPQDDEPKKLHVIP
jgi:beta-galactosidase/beta-glucuronidase